MSDWTGNKASARAQLGVVQLHNQPDREENDYYATHPQATEKLLEIEKLPYCIWECACGEGHISKVLSDAGHYVYSTDLIDRGYGTPCIDFLQQTEMPQWCKCIVTNPPYKYATEFILHGLELLPKGGIICMLLNITYLSGYSRYLKLYKNSPPKKIHIFTHRINCAKNGDFEHYSGSAINYGWFVWEKGYIGETIISWIDCSDKNNK